MARERSIHQTLGGAIFLTSGVAVALASVVFIGYDWVSQRRAIALHVETLAEVIGLNTADALSFADPDTANLTLRSLSAAPEVIGAVVYDAEGQAFAAYRQSDELGERFETPAAAGSLGARFASRHLDLVAPLTLDGERLGTILVRWNTAALTRRASSFAAVVCLLLVAVYFVSRGVTRALRERVSNPLQSLVEGARDVAEGRLGTRVATRSGGEIGAVAGAFNAMAEGLQELVARVRESIANVAEVADQLRADSRGMSTDAQRQGEAIDAAATSIGSVTGSVTEVNEHVDQLAARARETSSSILEMDASINDVATHMDGLADSIDGASSGAAQLSASVESIAAAMDGLEGATDETAALLRQLADAVRGVETNARECGELSGEATQEASRGREAVGETIASMREIRTSFERIETSVGGLAEKSGAIGEVLAVIESVVERTNLLALNAAIIASQAGEQGRAFSVVAGEVRNLAEHTARSTHEIGNLIDSVQRETRAAVAAVAAGSETVERGVDRSREAGEVLGGIIEKAERSARRVSEIVEATGRQAEDIQHVESAMERVRARVDETNQSTREQAKLAAAIGGVVERIRDLGHEVKRATSEMRRQSELITRAVHDVDRGVDGILEKSHAQAREGENIHRALGVFREVASESARRSGDFERMIEGLAERSTGLEGAIDRLDR